MEEPSWQIDTTIPGDDVMAEDGLTFPLMHIGHRTQSSAYSMMHLVGNLIFGSDFWDPHCKRNSDSVFDSGASGRFFFEIPMSGESGNRNSDLGYLEFL